MTIYVGRWDLLPESWEGVNGLYEKSEEEIRAEISREVDLEEWDHEIAVYTPAEFEETFNHTLTQHLSSQRYWIKIFSDGKSVLSE